MRLESTVRLPCALPGPTFPEGEPPSSAAGALRAHCAYWSTNPGLPSRRASVTSETPLKGIQAPIRTWELLW
jgi:hypothetical protein